MITVVNPWHWLDEAGELLEEPRIRARMLRVAQCIEYGGPLAHGEARETLIACRRRPGRTPCLGLLWVVKQEDDAIHAFCAVCQADEFMIYEWEDTQWAQGPMEPVNVAAEARERAVVSRAAGPRDTDERLQRALALVGSGLTVSEVRHLVQASSHPSEVVGAVLRHAKTSPTDGATERLVPLLIEAWNDTPRTELGGRTPTEVAGPPDTFPGAPPGPASVPAKSRTTRAGRNDPCPCGSGKKYKRCCIRDAPN